MVKVWCREGIDGHSLTSRYSAMKVCPLKATRTDWAMGVTTSCQVALIIQVSDAGSRDRARDLTARCSVIVGDLNLLATSAPIIPSF